MFMSPLCAGIAQLVERNLAKVEVAGSNPVSRSILVYHLDLFIAALSIRWWRAVLPAVTTPQSPPMPAPI